MGLRRGHKYAYRFPYCHLFLTRILQSSAPSYYVSCATGDTIASSNPTSATSAVHQATQYLFRRGRISPAASHSLHPDGQYSFPAHNLNLGLMFLTLLLTGRLVHLHLFPHVRPRQYNPPVLFQPLHHVLHHRIRHMTRPMFRNTPLPRTAWYEDCRGSYPVLVIPRTIYYYPTIFLSIHAPVYLLMNIYSVRYLVLCKWS